MPSRVRSAGRWVLIARAAVEEGRGARRQRVVRPATRNACGRLSECGDLPPRKIVRKHAHCDSSTFRGTRNRKRRSRCRLPRSAEGNERKNGSEDRYGEMQTTPKKATHLTADEIVARNPLLRERLGHTSLDSSRPSRNHDPTRPAKRPLWFRLGRVKNGSNALGVRAPRSSSP
jgi:hypothetical protein